MSYTLDQALALLDTPNYSGLDGLRRLVAETSAVPTGGAQNASLLLFAGEGGDYHAWQVATTLSASSVDATGAKQLVTIGDTAVSALLNRDVFLERLNIRTSEHPGSRTSANIPNIRNIRGQVLH